MSAFRALIPAFLIAIRIFIISDVYSQKTDPPYLKYLNAPWVDSVLNTLTPGQQIAQCIWIAAYSNRDLAHEVEISDLIRKFGIGGLIFFQGDAAKQAELTNYYQSISQVPLAVSQDAEWGVGMRLINVEKFPYQMTLGAIKNDSLIYELGKAVANQFKRLGMQMNLAPVADININPHNPVINYRSFGEERENVASKASMYMKGMQDNGIITTGKHFPGHGDTNIDSHLDLPQIMHNRQRLDSIELFPFRRLIDDGIGSIMTAHLNLPSLDTTTGLPSTLSSVIINGLLKEELGFKGLVITDAMNMQGISKYFKTGEADAKALAAGNDIVEFVTDVGAAIEETKTYIAQNIITSEDIKNKCRKILAAKYWAGLNRINVIDKNDIENNLSPGSSVALINDLYANALTVLNNDQNIIPLRNPEKLKIATLAINKSTETTFQKRLEKYFPADHFNLNVSDQNACEDMLALLSEYDIVITGIYGLDQRPYTDFGISQGLDTFIGKLTSQNRTVASWFGNPYGINRLASLNSAAGLILTYQENNYTEDLSAQLIYGALGAHGSLPVTINERWPVGYGLITPGKLRLQYGVPENAGVSSDLLNNKIDSIVDRGLAAKAFPGCEVMIARNGVAIFQKVYGYQTYDKRVPLLDDDVFDLASVTKVSATLPGLMLLDSKGKFSPDETLAAYLPEFKNSNKRDISLREMLTHQAGLTAWIPFWKETVKQNGNFKRKTLDYKNSDRFPVEVAQGLYINKNYKKKIFKEIKKSPLGEKKYLYSDLTFILSPEIISKLSGRRWDEFVTDSIYHQIGAYDLVFNPYQKYPLSRIVPTEYDSLFRKQQLRGTVHDEGAAMLGGISGHAGLFATANDLMKLMELYRRMGEYGGEQLIGRQVMEEYTSIQYPENNNRRGLGFDKPLINNSELTQKDAYPTLGASSSSFGHSGYTGTFVWVDPEYGISYVFLCNRVYPTRNNNLISDLNIRTDILQAIYDSIYK